jgi:putative ABC transport system permease protein
MLDWKQFVREHLPPLGLAGAREAEIREELAQQLEDAHGEALALGATEDEAVARAVAQIRDWEALARELREAEQPVAERVAERIDRYSFPAGTRQGMGTPEGRRRRLVMRLAGFMSNLWQDARYGARMLRTNAGFTVVIVLTLALGIGANTAIFSVVNAVLLRPLPYPEPSRLAVIWGRQAEQGATNQHVAYQDFEDLRRQNHTLDGAAAILLQQWTLTTNGEAARVDGLLVSANFFRVLGVAPALGRAFLAEEEQDSKDHVAVLGHRLWQERFGADPGIVGRLIALDGGSYTVVGVLPASFSFNLPWSTSYFPGDWEVWVPLTRVNRLARSRAIFTFETIARLKPGVSFARAQVDLATIGKQLEAAYPETNRGRTFQVVPLQAQFSGELRPALLLLTGAVGLVLLIVCTNLAALLLARGASRAKEIAVRTALGASRRRLVWQLLTESLLFAFLGGAAGLLAGVWTSKVLGPALVGNFPGNAVPALDGRVVAFALGVTLLTSVLFGLVPALSVARVDPQGALKDSPGSAPSASRLRSTLAVAETALAFVLLVGTGLLAISFYSLLQVNPGFASKGLLTFQISFSDSRYPKWGQILAFERQFEERVKALPGVQASAISLSLPLSGQNIGSAVYVEGQPQPPGAQDAPLGWQTVSPDYFRAMGIPLLRGRAFREQDFQSKQHLTILSESLARQVFPGEDPIGKHVSFGLPDPKNPDWHEVIGVVGDVRHADLASSPIPRGYDLFGQHGDSTVFVVVRAVGDVRGYLPALRDIVGQLDKEMPVFAFATMEELAARTLAPRRQLLLLVTAFGGMALLLAALGLYGLMAYSVGQRTREIGIRIALGAQRADIQKMVLRQGLGLILAGIALGLPAALALTRLLGGFIFGVTPADPVTYIVAGAVLVCAALLACYLPARRATRVDPLVALHYE